MANLAASAVTVNNTWTEGSRNGRRFLVKDVTLALTANGSLANNIPASLFGMTKIDYSRSFRDSSSNVLSTAPSYDGSYLVFATAETAGTPIDQTATVRGIVAGH